MKELSAAKPQDPPNESPCSAERLLSDVTSVSPDAIYVKDCNSRLLFANSALERIMGKPISELLGKTDAEIYPDPEIGKAIMANDRRIIESGRAATFEESCDLPDGRHFFISQKSPRFDEKGNVIGIVGISHDITARKKREQALKESEERFRRAVEDAPIPIIVYAEDGEVLQISRSWTESTGYTKNHMRDFDEWITQAVYSEGANQVRDHLHELFKGGRRSLNVEFGVRTTRGDVRHWSFNASSPGTLRDGRRFITGMALDVTERKQMLTKLEEYAKNLEALVNERTWKLESTALYARSLIEASLDPLVTISADGKITDVNKATESVTGYSREELIGSDFSNYFTEPEKAAAGYKQVFTEGFVKDYPLVIQHKSGRITEVLYNATVYRNSEGEVRGVFAAARDITERKKLENKLQDTERLAAIGQTAGMVGHDIRNPLQAISGGVYLLKSDLEALPESEEKENMREVLNEVEKCTDYIDKIVRDLQDYSKVIKPVPERIDLEDLFENLLLTMQIPDNIHASCITDKNAKIVFVDPTLLQRILNNLVLNSVHSMPQGGQLTLHAIMEKGDTVITVQDSGEGIPEDIKPKLFTPLFTTKSKGQGFGLPVVKRMTEALGGTVSFESEVGKGTKFILRLPAIQK